MGAFTLYLSDVTRQHSRLGQYDDQELDTHIVQHEGRRGPMDAQLLSGVGFVTMPVDGDRLLIMQKDGQSYVIAGACQPAEQSLALSAGERALYSTDTAQAMRAVLKMLADGTVELGTPGAPEITTAEGNTSIAGSMDVGGAGADYVALAAKVDSLWDTLHQLFTTWAPIAQDGGASLKTAYTAAFPAGPASVAATNLKTK